MPKREIVTSPASRLSHSIGRSGQLGMVALGRPPLA